MVRLTGFEPTTFFTLCVKSLRRIERASHLEVAASPALHDTKKVTPNGVTFLVRLTGFEPTTSRVGVWHSIQLSYSRVSVRIYKGRGIWYNTARYKTGGLPLKRMQGVL